MEDQEEYSKDNEDYNDENRLVQEIVAKEAIAVYDAIV